MKKIYQFIVIFLLLIETNFFSLIKLPTFISALTSYHTKQLTLIVCLFSFVLWFLFEKMSRHTVSRYYNTPIVIFLFSTIVISIMSMLIYNQSILSVLRVSYFYYIILLFYFLSYFCWKDKKNYHFLINSIILFGTIYSILLIVQYLFFKSGLDAFLIFNDENLVVLSKSINPRIARPADFIAFSSVLLFSKIVTGNAFSINKSKLWILLLIELIYILLVSQTRMYIIALLISFSISVLFIKRRNQGMSIVVYIILVPVIFLMANDSLSKFFSSFMTGDRVSSTLIRSQEILFYSRQIFSNGIIGRGFIDISSPDYVLLNHGPFGTYNTSDIGIIGFLSIYGLCGGLFLVFTIRKIIRTLKNNKENALQLKSIELITLCPYFLLVSLTLFYTDIQRIIYLPIILTIFEFAHKESIEKARDS
ncbi:hypothetical protein SAMN05216191_11183 [Paenibacillus jilunlii]|uniref:O-Antigen ligase n=2 Tax=Paenibacillus jilunlii TaxID=682956 RepID=A0A1G9S6U4_9BACL|nr:hypothetical protein SAMN05216191_11183 [Paenibacillus jilunlii]